MVNVDRLFFTACLAVAVFIGLARVEAQGVPRELTGGAPILLAPGEATPATEHADVQFVRGRIDAARYSAAPIDVRDRSTPLWLAATATLTLALAALSPKRAMLAVIGVALAWTIGLAVALAARPAIDHVAAADGSLWLIARRPTTASVPIVSGAAWVPIVESSRHWQTLAPRVVVDAAGRATLELTLPAAGTRVELSRR